jgi:GNAT superfamily N-acetyltransferase
MKENIIITRITETDFLDFMRQFPDEVEEIFGMRYEEGELGNITLWAVKDDAGNICAVCSIVVYMNPNEFERWGVEISDCFTAPDQRKKGYFSALVEHAKGVAEVMQTQLRCIAILETSYPIFKKLGFEETRKASVSMCYTPPNVRKKLALEQVYETT